MEISSIAPDESKDVKNLEGLVSAVITTYQRPELAKRAILSVLEQTYNPIEIIVVEDGGESDLGAWCDDYAPGKIIYIYHQFNKGLAAARNTGLRISKGSYVAYLDDDDLWKPERIEKQMQILMKASYQEQANIGVVSCGTEIHFPWSNRVSMRGHGNVGNLKESIINYGLSTPSSTFLFLRSALIKVGGFDESLPSSIDHDVWMSLAASGYEGRGIDDHLVVIYDRRGRITMMNNVETRIDGVKKFLRKWQSVHESWYGLTGGKNYQVRYFITVISDLAASKLWAGDMLNFFRVFKELFAFSRNYICTLYILSNRIVLFGSQRLLSERTIFFLKKIYAKLIR